MQDFIEKSITLNAPLSRVWRAITDSEQFGTWFKVRFEAPFSVGIPISGQVTYPGYEHLQMQVIPRELNPETYFSFTWCPYSDGAPEGQDRETLVEFKLRPVEARTHLIIVESGFMALPADARRDEAFRMNTQGWDAQVTNIADYVQS